MFIFELIKLWQMFFIFKIFCDYRIWVMMLDLHAISVIFVYL